MKGEEWKGGNERLRKIYGKGKMDEKEKGEGENEKRGFERGKGRRD